MRTTSTTWSADASQLSSAVMDTTATTRHRDGAHQAKQKQKETPQTD